MNVVVIGGCYKFAELRGVRRHIGGMNDKTRHGQLDELIYLSGINDGHRFYPLISMPSQRIF